MQSAMQATRTSTGSRLRILMVDDHPVVLAGVRAFLDEVSDLEVIATAATVEDAISRAQVLRPDAFLLTVSASGSAPAESARRLRSQCPEIALVVLSLDADCAPAKEMQAAGASAVLEKGAGRDAVIAALQALRTGDETGTRRLGARRDSVPPPSLHAGFAVSARRSRSSSSAWTPTVHRQRRCKRPGPVPCSRRAPAATQ